MGTISSKDKRAITAPAALSSFFRIQMVEMSWNIVMADCFYAAID